MHSSFEDTKYLEIIQEVAKYNGFVDYNITFNKNTSGVDGYASTIIEAQIISSSRELNLVIKSVGCKDKIRTVLPIESMMNREILMYETVFPLFQQFGVEHGIPLSYFAPTYHRSHKNNQYHALLLSNLKNEGFSIFDRKSLLDDVHVKLAIKHYAQLHAASLAYKDQNASKFKILIESMDDFYLELYTKSDFIKLLVKQMRKAAESLDSNQHGRIRTIFENFVSEAESFIVGLQSMVDDFSVIIHGDCWKNNMMFKYGDSNNPSTPTEVRLIDFQLSRLANPMLDIANFFYSCSSINVIDNMKNYLEFYYQDLSSRLQNLGSDPNKIYPYSTMMEHWRKFARMGLILRPSALCVLLGKESEFKGISDALELDGSFENMLDYEILDIEEYNKLCKHTVVHFVHNNLI